VPSAVISTVCVVHNWFGRVYLFFVVPFHKWGVRWLISNALAAAGYEYVVHLRPEVADQPLIAPEVLRRPSPASALGELKR